MRDEGERLIGRPALREVLRGGVGPVGPIGDLGDGIATYWPIGKCRKAWPATGLPTALVTSSITQSRAPVHDVDVDDDAESVALLTVPIRQRDCVPRDGSKP